ncbi:hypothetical protein AX16_006592 [Volvariella volvacea WC 439]|nr:hypothetical protein AX16_006592 [Volvariella volvacea WC 439]
MFFYLSFLRAPPTQSTLNQPITLTPQIANDLRTELFDGSQDLYYQWLPLSSRPAIGREREELFQASPTRPVKLTTWRSSSTYKELTIPPPLREGKVTSWILILCADPHNNPGEIPVIRLDDPRIGRIPFPVLSLPIQIHTRASKEKQTRIQRVYQWGNSDAEISRLIITEQTSFDLDKKIWDSGIGLSSWFVRLKRRAVTDVSCLRLKETLFSDQSRNVIELGAGTGIVALTLSALRAEDPSSDRHDELYTTDLPSAMPLLEENIARNKHLFSSNPPQARVLDWEIESLPEYTDKFAGCIDAIVMADVTYNTDSFPALVATILKLIKLSKKPPVILLGYKERHSTERTLWDLIGIPLTKVDEIPGAGGTSIEVWVHVPEYLIA